MDRWAITSDTVAGLSVAALLLPEAIAYGSIAGFPPGHALIAALAGMAVYAVAGRSRVAIVAPTSASAATLAAAMATLALADPAQRLLAAVAMVGFAGILFVLAGVLRLGFIAAFVSRSSGRIISGETSSMRSSRRSSTRRSHWLERPRRASCRAGAVSIRIAPTPDDRRIARIPCRMTIG